MKNIKLIGPDLEIKEKAMEFRQEFLDNNEMVINGSELFDKTESYEDLQLSLNREKGHIDEKTK